MNYNVKQTSIFLEVPVLYVICLMGSCGHNGAWLMELGVEVFGFGVT